MDMNGWEPNTPGWNGQPCEARVVRVVVADNGRFPLYWARDLAGTEREAVEVKYAGNTFYLDNEGHDGNGYPGWGMAKVMAGGSPQMSHASLEIERVLDDACSECAGTGTGDDLRCTACGGSGEA